MEGDLEAVAEYTLAVQKAGGPDGVVLFTGLPLELAMALSGSTGSKVPFRKMARNP